MFSQPTKKRSAPSSPSSPSTGGGATKRPAAKNSSKMTAPSMDKLFQIFEQPRHEWPFLAAKLNMPELFKRTATLYTPDSPMQVAICEVAANLDHLDILRWAVEELGYPLLDSVLVSAILEDRLEVVQWIIAQNSCYVHEEKVCRFAVEWAAPRVLSWGIKKIGKTTKAELATCFVSNAYKSWYTDEKRAKICAILATLDNKN